MATIDLTTGGATAIPAVTLHPRWIEKTFDASAQNLAAADVAKLINIPPKCWVDMVQYEVTKVQGAVATFDLGDTTTPAGFVSNANANALGSGVSGPVAGYVNTSDAGVAQDPVVLSLAYSGGKYYATADTINLVSDNALTLAIITVRALVTQFV